MVYSQGVEHGSVRMYRERFTMNMHYVKYSTGVGFLYKRWTGEAKDTLG